MTLLQSFGSTDYMKWKVSKTLTFVHSCYASQLQPSTIILYPSSNVLTELKAHTASTSFQHPYFGRSSNPLPTYKQPATPCEPTAQFIPNKNNLTGIYEQYETLKTYSQYVDLQKRCCEYVFPTLRVMYSR